MMNLGASVSQQRVTGIDHLFAEIISHLCAEGDAEQKSGRSECMNNTWILRAARRIPDRIHLWTSEHSDMWFSTGVNRVYSSTWFQDKETFVLRVIIVQPCPPPVNLDALSPTLASQPCQPFSFLWTQSPTSSSHFVSWTLLTSSPICISLRLVGHFLLLCPFYFLLADCLSVCPPLSILFFLLFFCLFRAQVFAPQHQSVGCSGADLSISGAGFFGGEGANPAFFFSSLLLQKEV